MFRRFFSYLLPAMYAASRAALFDEYLAAYHSSVTREDYLAWCFQRIASLPDVQSWQYQEYPLQYDTGRCLAILARCVRMDRRRARTHVTRRPRGAHPHAVRLPLRACSVEVARRAVNAVWALWPDFTVVLIIGKFH